MTNKLLIVDGNNIATRAFFVGNHFGVFNMVLSAAERIDPTHLIVAFDDSSAPSWRKELFNGYKATRKHDPKRNRYLAAVVDAFSNNVETVQSGEADDAIATLCAMLPDDTHAFILSNDSDFEALVSDNVTQITWEGAFRNWIMMTQGEVVSRRGVEPCQIADLKALMGDKSDCVPGVRGVGPKRAARILLEFGTLDDAIHHITIHQPAGGWKKPAWKRMLSAQVDDALLSRALVELRIIGSIELDLGKCVFNAERIHEAAREFKWTG